MTLNNFLFITLSIPTLVILSSSKDGVLIEDNLRRIPRHFDKLSVTVENMKKIIELRKKQILKKILRRVIC